MDQLLNPEDISIRQPLFWFGIVIFSLAMVGGIFADLTYGHALSVGFDVFSLASALIMAFLVRGQKVGMQVGLGGLVYLGAANFILTLVLRLLDPGAVTEAFLYKDLFMYSLFMGLGVVLVGRSAALVFGGLLLVLLLAARPQVASQEFSADVWFEVPLVAGALYLLYRYRAALDRLVADQRRMIRENQALRSRERLAALGELTAGISHEIKNPLNLVINFAESSQSLLADLEATLAPLPADDPQRAEREYLVAELRQNLADLKTQGHRGVTIVQSMLLHARTDTGELQVLDLVALVGESLNLAALGPQSGVRAIPVGRALVAPPDPVPVAGSPGELSRVFLNLCSNAFWSASERKLRNPGGPEPRVEVTISTDQSEVRVDVRDNGLGFDPQARERLFAPFFTTKPPGQGTGLGLSLAQEMVARHRGRIDARGTLGTGAVFTVWLPLAT